MIQGTIHGKSINETYFSAATNAENQILFSFSCNWLKSGPVNVEIENQNLYPVVYFSDPDTCQNRYLVNIDDNPFIYPFD